MQLTTKLTLTLGCAVLVFTSPALADTLRCGASLIQPGDDARYVLEKCGEPDSWPVLGDPAAEQGLIVYGVGIVRADRWRYHRGSGRFPVIVAIAEDGRVQDIQFERVRDP